jgi:ATP-binding cassette subfamily B protein
LNVVIGGIVVIFGKHINKFYLKYLIYFIIGIVALIAVDFIQLEIPNIIGNTIDGVKDGWLTKDLISGYMLTLLKIVGVMFVGRFLWRICIFGNGIRIEADLRDDMFKHAEKMSQRYYQENKTGALMALFTNDLQTIRQAFGPGTIMAIDAVVLGGLAFKRMWDMDITLTLISSIPLIILALCGKIIGDYMGKKFSLRQKAFSDMSDFTQESFSGISVIKAFVKEGKELLSFRKINKDNMDRNIDFARAAVLLEVLIMMFISSIIIIIFGYGSYLVYENRFYSNPEFTIGGLTKFVSYFTTLIWPMMAIAQLINLRSQGKASLKRIDTLLDEKVEIKDSESVVSHDVVGTIEFKDFSFKYPNAEVEALSNITFRLNKGESLGIIGRTGSGKTTLVDSLLRIHNIENDKIFIDGLDINDIKITDVRDGIAYVPQDNFLFSDTIENNINFSRVDLNEEEVKAAAILSDVDENIMDFPLQYKTVLGERGTTVSGGQKQRISIARALLKDPSILILDDSVSAVDTKTEEKILTNLKKTRRGKTTVLIAHRVSTVKSLDKIALLDEGKLIGFGSHKELLKNNPAYKKMVDLQHLEDEVGGAL